MNKRVCVTCVAAIALSVAGCGRLGFQQSGPEFDDRRFRGSAKTESRGDRQSFVSTASPVSASLDGARAKAAFEGVRHCIQYFGTSDIDWSIGPDTPPEALTIENDRLTFAGRCIDSD